MSKEIITRQERADDEHVREGEWSREARRPPLSSGKVRYAGVDEDRHKNKDDLNVVKVVESLLCVSSTLEKSLVQYIS